MTDLKRSCAILMDSDGNVLIPCKDEVNGFSLLAVNPYDAPTVTQQLPLGTRIVQGEREFRYVKAGGVALVAGFTVQSAPAPSAGHVMDMVTAAAAVGATDITVTPVTNNITANQYKDGYLFVNDATGEGQCFRVKSNPAITATETGVISLYDPVTLALDATALTGLRLNPYNGVVVTPITTLTGTVVGVSHRAITASYFGWIQTKGPAAVHTIGSLVLGQNAIAPVGTTAGSVGPEAAAGISAVIGTVMNVSVTTDKSLIFLNLP